MRSRPRSPAKASRRSASLVRDELAAGQLAQPFGPFRYHLLRREHDADRSGARRPSLADLGGETLDRRHNGGVAECADQLNKRPFLESASVKLNGRK